MPLASWGGGGDWSSEFAVLARNMLSDQQQGADYIDAKREERQAAHDQEVFDQYGAGKLSGQEILAYIQQRVRETKYDPKQHETWTKAYLQYSESIADNSAEAKFANGGSIWDLIGYYRQKLGGLAKNNPKYADTQKRIRDLTDQGVAQDVQAGAERISNKIATGDATIGDLLAFYKSHLSNARVGSDIYKQITSAISDTRVKLHQQQFDTSIARIGLQLSEHAITPQEAGRQQLELIVNSGLRNSDPTRYYSMLDDANKLVNTVDDQSQLAQIDYLVQSQQITPQEAEQRYYAEAAKYKTFDPTTYYNLMTRGFQAGHPSGSTPLQNPNALNGLYGPNSQPTPYAGPGGTFKWISQLDGSEFADINCAAASTAMLAHLLGIRGLSGGDIRYLSHDTSGGISLDQDAAVLRQLGAKGLTSTYSDPIAFEQFKQRILAGSPAVLSGIYGNVAANLRVSPKLWGTHQMMIGEYDPKRDAFLVFDPAVSQRSHPNYKGEWWPASQVKNFGWGPSLNGFVRYGQALFAPAGTIANGRGTATHIRFVSVDTPPMRSETPRSYVGLNNPGNAGQVPGQHPTVTTGGNARNPAAQSPGGDTRPMTQEEAQKVLDANNARVATIGSMTDAFARGETSITIGGETYSLDASTVSALNQEALHKFDWDIALTEAMGDAGAAADLRSKRSSFVVSVKTANAIPVAQLWGTLLRDANADLRLADLETDPTKAQKYITDILARVTAFQQAQQRADTQPVPTTDISPDGKPFTPTADLSGIDVPGTNQDLQGQIDATVQALTIAGDTTKTADQKAADLGLVLPATGLKLPTTDGQGDVGGQLISTIAGASTQIGMLERGEATRLLVNGSVQVVPFVERADPNDPSRIIQVPDISRFNNPANVDPLNLPTVVIDGRSGPESIIALPTLMQVGSYFQYAKDSPTTGGLKGQRLSTEDFAKLDPATLQQLVATGVITSAAATLPVIQTPPRLEQTFVTQLPDVNLGKHIVPGEQYVQDPGTKGWAPITNGVIPFASSHLPTGIPGVVAWDPEANGPAYDYKRTNEVPAPYAGSNPRAVQDAVVMGHLQLPTVVLRDDNGNLTDVADPRPYDPGAAGWADKARQLTSQVPPLPDSNPNTAMDIWKSATSTSKAQYYGQDNQTFSPPASPYPSKNAYYGPDAYTPPPAALSVARSIGLNLGDGHDLHQPQAKTITPPAPIVVYAASTKNKGGHDPVDLPRIGEPKKTSTKSSTKKKSTDYYTPPPPPPPPPPVKKKTEDTPTPPVKKTSWGWGVD